MIQRIQCITFRKGAYTPGSFHHGSFSGDTQWPWNLSGGDQGTSDTGDDWPEFVFGLPDGFDHQGPSQFPITSETIDFMNTLGNSPALGYCYDTIPFGP